MLQNINIRIIILVSLLLLIVFRLKAEDSTKVNLSNSPNKEKTRKIDSLIELSWSVRNSNPQKALKYAQTALLLAELRAYDKGKMKALSFAGVAEKNLGNYLNSLSYYYEALNLAEELNSKEDIAYSKINIGNIYIYQKEFKAAKKPLNAALEIGKQINKKEIVAYAYLNLGRVFSNENEYQKAFDRLHKSLQIRKSLKDSAGMAVCYKYIGDIHFTKNDYSKAERLYFKALEPVSKIRKDKDLISDIYNKLARTYLYQNKIRASEKAAEESYKMAGEIGSILRLRNSTFTLYEVYQKTGKHKKALDFFKKYSLYKDSLINAQNIKKITRLEEQHKYEKEENLRKLEEKKQKEIHKERLARERNKRYFLFILLAGFAVFTFVVVRSNIHRRKANKKLQKQNKTIERQNKEITDSINYAAKIQNAVLPPMADISTVYPDNFVLYLPRNIVSGDFYWTRKVNYNTTRHIIIIAADCTGHGVPGAFMSMLGIAFLNEIVNEFLHQKELSANLVLNELRQKVITSLHQTGKEKEAKDGMDISLCIINLETKKMQFAGAYNSIFIARKTELIKVRADRMPIGIHPGKMKDFSKKEVQLMPNDRLYLFSDGYPDQFGGNDNSKFLIKNFRKLILENYEKKMTEQKEIFYKTLKKWQGNNSQLDDILVLGIRIE